MDLTELYNFHLLISQSFWVFLHCLWRHTSEFFHVTCTGFYNLVGTWKQLTTTQLWYKGCFRVGQAR